MTEFLSLLEYIALIIEYIGVLFVILGAVLALGQFFTRQDWAVLRRNFAEKILLGLEFIIAADIILATLVYTQQDLIKLGAVVIIRILLGYSLKKEITQA
ncbi:MAG: DUF1622 domain-containing protein [bacterium]|nr:DUF1622 domain-containing protein [bacterium]